MELKIPEIYWDDEKAVRLLVEYFTRRRRPSGDLYYSGAHFERLGGGGDTEHVADRFDSNDLVAITMLSVSVEAHGAISLLTDPHGHWTRLLSLIPRDARLESPESDALMKEGGAAWELWERLATKEYVGKPDGSGPVIAGKLLARKRPHLIPIYDIRIKQLFGRPKTDHSFWAALAAALRADDGAFHHQLARLRDQARVGEDIGILRVFDVIAWMHQGPSGQGNAR
ncbi:DUF6308 family protein [Streptomyces sp. WM6386]|uniref:DUF6308 family protein n=1 Tax=Streptomyces sp. WM6386 TaxID=1415558 RepID=UPI000A529545|nr:DUF6308 family protein [Streptomyces sp. WM6386]